MAIRINSSLVPEETVEDNKSGPSIVHEAIPEGMQWPQWVNGKWQEYNADNDPMVLVSRQLEASYKENVFPHWSLTNGPNLG